MTPGNIDASSFSGTRLDLPGSSVTIERTVTSSDLSTDLPDFSAVLPSNTAVSYAVTLGDAVTDNTLNLSYIKARVEGDGGPDLGADLVTLVIGELTVSGA